VTAALTDQQIIATPTLCTETPHLEQSKGHPKKNSRQTCNVKRGVKRCYGKKKTGLLNTPMKTSRRPVRKKTERVSTTCRGKSSRMSIERRTEEISHRKKGKAVRANQRGDKKVTRPPQKISTARGQKKAQQTASQSATYEKETKNSAKLRGHLRGGR